MKHKYINTLALLAIGLLCCKAAYSQWQPLGSLAFSPGQVGYTSIAVDKNGTPYVAFQDMADSLNRLTVMKYNGSAWVNAGPPDFSLSQANFISLAIDSATGTPYVAYEDMNNGTGGLTVQKFNGATWDTLSFTDFTPGDAQYISLVVYHGIPYVAYEDYYDSSKVSVVKFTGSQWEYVDTSLSSPGVSTADATFISLATDHNGKLYVAYQDNSTPFDQATVMTFTGFTWVAVGDTLGFSAGEANYISLAINNNNQPVIAYSDANAVIPFAATVMEFKDSNWINLGQEGFTPGEADYTTLTFNKNGTPFLAFSDIVNSGKASVMQFNDSAWFNTGNTDFTGSEADYTSLAIDNNNILYVAYVDHSNSSAASVMTFDPLTGIAGTPAVESICVFPNPSDGYFSVKIEAAQPAEFELSVYDLTGRLLWQKQPFEINGTYISDIDIPSFASGLYLLQIKSGTELKTLKLELQK